MVELFIAVQGLPFFTVVYTENEEVFHHEHTKGVHWPCQECFFAP